MAQQLDPNALATLLKGQYQPSRYTPEEEQLNSMIPEEQLYQAQEAQGDAGRARGGSYAISSRDQLRQSGLAELRKMFGIQQAQAQAKAYPNQVAGEYGLQEARLKGGYDVEAAKQKAVADAAQRQAQNEFQTAQQGRQQAFAGGQGDMNRAAIERNTAANIAGRSDVAGQATARTAATQASIDARKNPPGMMDWLWNKATGKSSGNNSPAPVSPRATAAVQAARQDPTMANQTFQEILDSGSLQGATPDEIAAFQQAWGQ